MSNNSSRGVLAKLSRAGLADRTGTPYFKKIFGMDRFGLGWSKARPEVYMKIVAEIRHGKKEVIMIGDDYEQDLKSALEGGVDRCVIVDRRQAESCLCREKHVVVNNLENVLSLVPGVLR